MTTSVEIGFLADPNELRDEVSRFRITNDDGTVIATGDSALVMLDTHTLLTFGWYTSLTFTVGGTALLQGIDAPLLDAAFKLPYVCHMAAHVESPQRWEAGESGYYFGATRTGGSKLRLEMARGVVHDERREMVYEVGESVIVAWPDIKVPLMEFAHRAKTQAIDVAPALVEHVTIGPWLASHRVHFPLRRLYGLSKDFTPLSDDTY